MLADRLYQRIPVSIKHGVRSTLMRILRRRMTAHFSRFISPGDLVFDVGANVGDLTDIFLRLGARVICVEPQPYCVAILKQKFSRNPNVVIVEKGLNHQEGQLPFYVSSLDHPTSTFSKEMFTNSRYHTRAWDRTIEVPVTTLDYLIARFGTPAFCKIDVEGFELEVLQGLRSPVPALSFEFLREFLEDARVCAQRLASSGNVTFNYSLYITYAMRSDRWFSYDELFHELEFKANGYVHRYLSGDIYARIES